MNRQNPTLITLSLGLTALIGTLNITMFNIALPAMMAYFDAPLSTVQWLTSGFLLAAGMIIPAAGFLGDHIGYKRILCIILLAVLALSIIGPFSWCIEALILVRFLFGLFSGLLSPLSLAMMYRVLPTHQQAKAASIWSIALMLGGMLPSVLSGLILSVADWRFLLLFNVPFALLALFLCIRLLPADTITGNNRLDLVGLILTAFGSMSLLFTFSNLSSWGLSWKLFLGILLGIGCLAFYVMRSWNRPDALLNLSVLKYKHYVAALLVAGLNSLALYMITFLMPLFLQNGLGVSALLTGMIMLPPSLFTLFSMPVATKLYPKLGEKKLVVLGILILVVGSSPFLVASPATPIALILIAMCIRCCGMGFMQLIATNAQMSSVPAELSGHASSLSNWFQQVLNAFIVAAAGSVADMRVATAKAASDSAESLAYAYTSTTNLMMMVSCLLLISIIPIALKYFRGKEDLPKTN